MDKSKEKNLNNFLAYCPKGTILKKKTVDALEVLKTAVLLQKLFREVVIFVRLENICI
jgi:hypothetical protein